MPILDVFEDDVDPAISYIVMPFLRLIDDPPLQYVHDIVELTDQLLRVRVKLFRFDMI